MSVFEYVSVMVGVVLALAVSDILTYLANFVARPDRTRGYWLHTLWVILMFVLNLWAWVLLWTMHGQEEFPVWKLIAMLVTAALIFVASRILLPELSRDETVDLREHMIQIRVPFFSTLSLIGLIPILRGILVEAHAFTDPANLMRALMFVFAVSGLLIKKLVWWVWLAFLWGLPLVAALFLFWGTLR